MACRGGVETNLTWVVAGKDQYLSLVPAFYGVVVAVVVVVVVAIVVVVVVIVTITIKCHYD